MRNIIQKEKQVWAGAGQIVSNRGPGGGVLVMSACALNLSRKQPTTTHKNLPHIIRRSVSLRTGYEIEPLMIRHRAVEAFIETCES
jgi:hypothetical protein